MLALTRHCCYNYNPCTCQYSKNVRRDERVTVLRNSLTPCRPNAFHCARNQRLILQHSSHCDKAPGGRHHRAKRRQCRSAREIPGLQLTGLGRTAVLVSGMRRCLLLASRHSWILSFVTQSATSQCAAVSLPSKRALMSLYSCSFRAGREKKLGSSWGLKDLARLLFPRVKHFTANCVSQV